MYWAALIGSFFVIVLACVREREAVTKKKSRRQCNVGRGVSFGYVQDSG